MEDIGWWEITQNISRCNSGCCLPSNQVWTMVYRGSLNGSYLELTRIDSLVGAPPRYFKWADEWECLWDPRVNFFFLG